MSQVAIQSYIGRDYSIPFVIGKDILNVEKVTLKTGLNILSGEVWDKIKNHPMVKILLETSHDFCLSRRKQVDGDDKDNKYLTIRETFNVDGKNHMKIEVRDFRNVETDPAKEKKD